MSQCTWDNVPIILSIRDVAQLLDIGQTKAYELVNSGTIPRLKIGKTFKISRDVLKKWIEKDE